MGRLLDTTRDNAGLREHRRHGLGHAGQCSGLNGGHLLEFFGVDDRGEGRQGHRAARVAGAAAARNDRQPGLDAGPHQAGHFRLAIGRQHDERHLDPPVGRVGGVRDARKCVETDVVAPRVRRQCAPSTTAQVGYGLERRREGVHGATRGIEQPAYLAVSRDVGAIAATFDVAQAMFQRLDQQRATLGIIEQVLLEIGIAAHDPDVAEHLVQHARRATRAPFRAQVVQKRPPFGTQQARDDLTVREGRVVVGNLAQARRRVEWSVESDARFFQGAGYRVHVAESRAAGATGTFSPVAGTTDTGTSSPVAKTGTGPHSPIHEPGNRTALMIDIATAAA